MNSLLRRTVQAAGCIAAFVAVLGNCCFASADTANNQETERDYQLSLGGHALLTNSQVCDVDVDVVSCAAPWLAAGLDLAVLAYPKPDFGLGGRFAMTTGVDASGLGNQPHRQWLLRLMGEARWEDGGEEGGGFLGAAIGAALLLDRVVSNDLSIDRSSTLLSDQKGTDAGPAVGLSAGYDFLVYDRLLLGFVLRAELIYLLGIKRIDIGPGTYSFSSGLTPLVELGMRMSMSQ